MKTLTRSVFSPIYLMYFLLLHAFKDLNDHIQSYLKKTSVTYFPKGRLGSSAVFYWFLEFRKITIGVKLIRLLSSGISSQFVLPEANSGSTFKARFILGNLYGCTAASYIIVFSLFSMYPFLQLMPPLAEGYFSVLSQKVDLAQGFSLCLFSILFFLSLLRETMHFQ